MMETIYQAFLQCNGVCTDSRQCQAGNFFVCLKGDNFDGNVFAEKAVELGCRYVLTSRKELSDRITDSPNHRITESPYIYVEDTLATLQQLAAHHRRVLGTPIVGITGTNGKTTTKELVSAVLAKKYNVLYTLGNFNNHIGVPLTLLRLKPEHQMAVIEMGANHPGEIAFLANIVMPDAGLITNVGKAHLAGFGSFEGVKNTKAELYRNLVSRGKMVFLDDDNAHLKKMLANIEKGESALRQAQGPKGELSDRITDSPNHRITASPTHYGTAPTLPVNGQVLSCTPFVNIQLTIDGTSYTVNSKLIGCYNLSNMLSAACVGHHFGVDAAQIAQALSAYTPQNNRSQLTQTERNSLIVDAYNANPTSMEAALRNFALIESANKAVILGDMFELGDDSAAEHQKVVSLLEQLGITEAYLLGENFSQTQGTGMRFASTPAFKQWLTENPLSGKTLLIKGSNSMKLTTLVDAL
jgi:UDP-N-acetylmuramoyl-tripeptide--D-alanyl-D-alanine ligase